MYNSKTVLRLLNAVCFCNDLKCKGNMLETRVPKDRTILSSPQWTIPQVYQVVMVAVIVIGLVAIGGGLRLYRLSELPPGLFYDEGAHGLDALSVLQGEHAVFFPRNQGREGLIIYSIAALIPFLGQTILAVRLPTALASVGTILAVFYLGLVLFGNHSKEESRFNLSWRSLLIAGTSAGFLAVSLGQTIIGRISFRANFMPFLLALALALLWSGLQQHRRGQIILAAICTGLLPYTYIAARFVPFLLLIYALSLLWAQKISQQSIRQSLRLLLLYSAITALVAAPILTHFALHPEDFTSRSNNLWIFNPEINHGSLRNAFLYNLVDHLAAFGFKGDPNWRHNFDSRPWLNPVQAILFWIGIGVALWRWRQPAYRLLLLWIGVLLLPSLLALDSPPNTLRMIGIVPAVYLMTGVGFWQLISWGTKLLPACRHTLVYGITALLIVVLIAGQGVITARTYFQDWATNPEVYQTHRAEWTALANEINAESTGAPVAYLIPFGNQYGMDWRENSFDFLYQGTVPAHFFRSVSPNLAQEVQTALIADDVTEARSVNWTNGVHWSGDATERLPFLLGKYGNPIATLRQINYETYHFSDLLLDRPWSLYESIESLEVHYDGGLALRGIALGHRGGEQFTVKDSIPIGQDAQLWLVLHWQADLQPLADYAISLRIHNTAGELVYQLDKTLWSFDQAPTTSWLPGEQSESLAILHLPTELAAGEYTLRLVTYDIQTLIPTVQTEVWEAEVLLARLRVDH
jgi:4-amino-4-deoxy-L-arabinose transferase-like glycosyltransferase